MPSLLDQLYKAKLQLAAITLMVAGVLVRAFGAWLGAPPWLPSWAAAFLPDIGTSLFVAGIVGIYLDLRTRRENEALLDERLEHAIDKKAPAIRDAVLDSFAFDPAALKNVASNETLDRIATNALGLRLDDQALAHDVYTDLRDQVIRAPERWQDVDVSVTLSPWKKGPVTGHGSMFVATVRWEYRVTPASSTMRFACTADRDEYRELLRDPTVTGPWYISRNGGLDAASQDVFELVQFTVNGKPKAIRRTARSDAQLYTVSLGRAAAGNEVTVSYTYRVLVQRHGHVLYLDFPRPAKGSHIQLNYAGAGIRRINTLDYIASNQQARVDYTPDDSPAKTVDVGFDGWVFPRSGVAFVWVLKEELDQVRLR
jgi:hypothetical protein